MTDKRLAAAADEPSSGLSRRDLIGGAAAGVASAATLAAVTPVQVFGDAVPIRQDIFNFARDKAKMTTFKETVGEMMARSKMQLFDPKGWTALASEHKIHCSVSQYSNVQMHYCWWFLFWHRAYLHVAELKIRELSGDKTFCYPYWNWSSDRDIPAAFSEPGSPLSDALRFTPDRPLDDCEVCFNPDDPYLKSLGVSTLAPTHFQAYEPRQIKLSFGGIKRPNAFPSKDGTPGFYEMNAFENQPHGPVHVYVGGFGVYNGAITHGDMSDFATAALDPVFFAHHGNVDRLWENWRSDLKRRRTEPRGPEFDDHTFVFQWLDGGPIEIKVAQTKDTRSLDYQYDFLKVFRPGEIAFSVARNRHMQPQLPPIASHTLGMPTAASMQVRLAAGERFFLEIDGVENPGRPASLCVEMGPPQPPPEVPSAAQALSVGNIAVVGSTPNGNWQRQNFAFDASEAVKRFAGREATVRVVPLRLSRDAGESYAPLRYETMRIAAHQA